MLENITICNRNLCLSLLLIVLFSFPILSVFAQEVGVSNTTFTPKSLLHVHDNNATGQVFQLTNTTSGTGATTNGFIIDFEASFQAAFKNQYENASAGISFYTYTNGGALTEKLTILNDGNVGIGTSSPETKLHISGVTRISSTYSTSRFSNDAFGPYLQFEKSRNTTIGSHTVVQNGDVLGYIRFQGSDGDSYENAVQIRGVVDGVPADGDLKGELHFLTNNGGAETTRMILRANGFVGINTLSPSGRLEIYDTNADAAVSIQRNSGDQYGGYLNFKKSHSGIVSADDILGTIRFQGYDSDTWENAAQIRGCSDGIPGDEDMPGRLSFHTSPDGSETVIERMRIDNTGLVGINETALTHRFLSYEDRTALSTNISAVKGLNSSTVSTAGGGRDAYGGYFISNTTESDGGNTLTNVGVFANAVNGDNAYGIYATASGATGSNYAGYFNGDIYVTDDVMLSDDDYIGIWASCYVAFDDTDDKVEVQAGDFLVGSGANYTEIESDGDVFLYGTARKKKTLCVNALNMYGAADTYNGVVCAASGTTTFNNKFWYWRSFDQTIEEAATMVFQLPTEYEDGTDVDIVVSWSTGTAASNVKWGVGLIAVGVGESYNGAESYQTSTGSVGTAWFKTTFTVTFTGTNFVAGDDIAIVVYRDAADGTDVLAAYAYVCNVTLKYTANKLGE